MSLFTESKWTDNEVETLINLIRVHPVLWNSNCKDYKDPDARNSAFTTIAQQLCMPTAEIRNKYRNLRSQYVREVRLRRTRGFGTKWNFYESLKFLSSGQTNAKNDNWDTLISEDTQDYTEQIPITTKTEAHSTGDDEIGQFSEDYIEDSASFNGDYDAIETITDSGLAKRLRLQSETNEVDYDKNLKRRQRTLCQSKRDEHTVLGEHVANELRALKNKPALLKSLKCSILQAILDANKALET